MPKKKLLIVTDYFYPHWTGLSKSLLYLLEGIQDMADVSILTIKHDKTLPAKATLLKASIIRVPYLFSINRSKYSLMQVVMFIRMLSSFESVFINSPCANILILSILTKLFGKKLFIFHQGDLILPKSIINTCIEYIFNVATFLSFLLADKVATYTQDYGENSRLLKFFLQKFTPLMIPLSITPGLKTCVIKETLQILEKKHILIGFGGRFVEEKGFDVLFKAIPQVVKKIPTAQFVFAGEIHMEYEKFFEKNLSLLESVKDHITFCGLISSDCMEWFYKALTLLVVPSRSDCFNLVQAEAMLCGVPVVVSNIPGARFLVQKTQFGKTFQSENSNDLADKIIICITEKNLIQQKKKYVEEVFDNKRNVSLIQEFLFS